MAIEEANLTETMNNITYSDVEQIIEDAKLTDDELKSELKAMEERLKFAQKKKSFFDALQNLKSNKDFQTLFIDGYLNEESDRLLELIIGSKDDITRPPIFLKRDELDNVTDKLKSIRDLKAYLLVVEQNGSQVDSEIEEYNLYIKAIKSKLGIVGE
jgi:hypothetical protein